MLRRGPKSGDLVSRHTASVGHHESVRRWERHRPLLQTVVIMARVVVAINDDDGFVDPEPQAVRQDVGRTSKDFDCHPKKLFLELFSFFELDGRIVEQRVVHGGEVLGDELRFLRRDGQFVAR